MTIAELIKDAHERAKRKGWWDRQAEKCDCEEHRGELDRDEVEATIPEKLALIHSEVSEALEAYRDGELGTLLDNGKPEGFAVELADVVIRIADLCGALGIDLEEAIKLKSQYNETRAHRHGGKRA